MKDNKRISDEVVTVDISGSYEEQLKACLTELCYKLDIPKPYWLPKNAEEYNRRSKTSFNSDNFIEEIDFDKFIIEELEEKR